MAPASVCTDRDVLDAAARVIEQVGYGGLTLERLGDALGTSRMTLHRRKITIAAVVSGLALQAVEEYRAAMFPVLSEVSPARERLLAGLEAVFDVADRHLRLLSGLFAADDAVFHGTPDATGALPTSDDFIAPLVKLLADGEADGTLRAMNDRAETATALFNMAGWGYVQLRHAQRWPAGRARTAILTLLLDGPLR